MRRGRQGRRSNLLSNDYGGWWLAELAGAAEDAQMKIRGLAPKRHNASTERRLAELYRELDAIADEAAHIERQLLAI